MQVRQHFDIIIIGAGLSGIGSACLLQQQFPNKSFVILEKMDSFGGTWLLHKYPGTRTDSDLYTFGYHFKAWTGKPIAPRHEILQYFGETIDEYGLAPHIRYNHAVESANWSSDKQKWFIHVNHNGEQFTLSTDFLWTCQGYYRHDKGYTPDWAGLGDFKGKVIHPQHWDESVDLTDKKVVVIGSGATSATLIPSLAGKCQHVTMLQRTPTYFNPKRNNEDLADQLNALGTNKMWTHTIMRKKMAVERDELRKKVEKGTQMMSEYFIGLVREQLPEGFDVDKHFRPPYNPFDQRLAFVPDGDLFKAIREGQASIVTDKISHFDENGIVLQSGERLDADVVVTATGFNLSIMGNVPIFVDDKQVNFGDTITLRGIMFSGVPNLVATIGYAFQSWTMRLELICQFTFNLLEYMEKNSYKTVVPTLREEDKNMELKPFLDMQSGYVQRGMDNIPKQGSKPEWSFSQDYFLECEILPNIDYSQDVFVYSK